MSGRRVKFGEIYGARAQLQCRRFARGRRQSSPLPPAAPEHRVAVLHAALVSGRVLDGQTYNRTC